jgi:hypothetical protein
MTQGFSGLGLHLGNLSRLSSAKSRSISAENPTGDKGKGGMAEDGTGATHARGLGRGWKISPSKRVAPGETLLLAGHRGCWRDPADMDHSGERALAISSFAFTGTGRAFLRSRRRSGTSSPVAGAATLRRARLPSASIRGARPTVIGRCPSAAERGSFWRTGILTRRRSFTGRSVTP